MMQHEPTLCIIIFIVYFLTYLPGFHLGDYGVGDFVLLSLSLSQPFSLI